MERQNDLPSPNFEVLSILNRGGCDACYFDVGRRLRMRGPADQKNSGAYVIEAGGSQLAI